MGALHSEGIKILCVVINILTCSVHRNVFKGGWGGGGSIVPWHNAPSFDSAF